MFAEQMVVSVSQKRNYKLAWSASIDDEWDCFWFGWCKTCYCLELTQIQTNQNVWKMSMKCTHVCTSSNWEVGINLLSSRIPSSNKVANNDEFKQTFRSISTRFRLQPNKLTQSTYKIMNMWLHFTVIGDCDTVDSFMKWNARDTRVRYSFPQKWPFAVWWPQYVQLRSLSKMQLSARRIRSSHMGIRTHAGWAGKIPNTCRIAVIKLNTRNWRKEEKRIHLLFKCVRNGFHCHRCMTTTTIQIRDMVVLITLSWNWPFWIKIKSSNQDEDAKKRKGTKER